jgi:hypothetical protein
LTAGQSPKTMPGLKQPGRATETVRSINNKVHLEFRPGSI